MNSWLLMYLIGIILMISLTFFTNRNVKTKDIKLKALLKSIIICFGSWISMYVIAIMLIKNN